MDFFTDGYPSKNHGRHQQGENASKVVALAKVAGAPPLVIAAMTHGTDTVSERLRRAATAVEECAGFRRTAAGHVFALWLDGYLKDDVAVMVAEALQLDDAYLELADRTDEERKALRERFDERQSWPV